MHVSSEVSRCPVELIPCRSALDCNLSNLINQAPAVKNVATELLFPVDL